MKEESKNKLKTIGLIALVVSIYFGASALDEQTNINAKEAKKPVMEQMHIEYDEYNRECYRIVKDGYVYLVPIDEIDNISEEELQEYQVGYQIKLIP